MERRCHKCNASFSHAYEFCPVDGNQHVAEAAETRESSASPEPAPEPATQQANEQAAKPATKPAVEPEPTPEASASPASPRVAILDVLKSYLGGKPADDQASILPPHEVAAGWEITGAVRHLAKSDHYPVRNTDGRTATYIRFRNGVLTPPAIYAHLQAVPGRLPGLSRLFSYGTTRHRDLEIAYEITEAADGIPLEDWLGRNGGSEEAALLLVRAFNEFLQRLHGNMLQAIMVEPDMLSIRNGQLTLQVLGALTAVTTAPAFLDSIAHSTLVGSPYAAPEIFQRGVITPSSGEFSAGQICARARLGEPVPYDTLLNARVPFQSIANPEIARFLMETLWPDGEERRTIRQMTGNPDAPPPPWDRLRPGAAANAFSLGGRNYWHASDLMLATVRHWDEASARLPELSRWLETTPFAAEARTMAASSHRSADWRLVRLVRLVAPDAPLFWKTYSLNDGDVDATLTNLAQRALDGDTTARTDIDRLLAADLRDAYAPLH